MSSPSTGAVPTPGHPVITGGIALPKPLSGWRVLVPRGGPWGDAVAADIRAHGGHPVVAPMINFAGVEDEQPLIDALGALERGVFDWLTVTSATTVDVLSAHRVSIPTDTRVAAVGETTASALAAAGYRADFVPIDDSSAQGLLAAWPVATHGAQGLRVLALRSSLAQPMLTTGLRALGHEVVSVVAYRTVGVPVPEAVVRDVESGRINAILITSGSVAEQVQEQFGTVPQTTLVAAIGPRTATDARAVGLRIDAVSPDRSAASLVEMVAAVADARGERADGG
jgi:uroporphyrinogen-III synthase